MQINKFVIKRMVKNEIVFKAMIKTKNINIILKYSGFQEIAIF